MVGEHDHCGHYLWWLLVYSQATHRQLDCTALVFEEYLSWHRAYHVFMGCLLASAVVRIRTVAALHRT